MIDEIQHRPYKGPQELSVKTPHRGLITYKEIKIKQVKDHKRTMDYLFFRKDIQHDKVAYYGASAGVNSKFNWNYPYENSSKTFL